VGEEARDANSIGGKGQRKTAPREARHRTGGGKGGRCNLPIMDADQSGRGRQIKSAGKGQNNQQRNCWDGGKKNTVLRKISLLL